ncbi:hypothetical protein ABW20_dc0102342 [Dactylellina cionopaga]|nr:hypothetical protein ABW20_dc0102342 [Dactylellina cionopaga]
MEDPPQHHQQKADSQHERVQEILKIQQSSLCKREELPGKDYFSCLPTELLYEICHYLTWWDIEKFAQCSRYIYRASFLARYKEVNVNAISMKAFQDGGLLHSLRGSGYIRCVALFPTAGDLDVIDINTRVEFVQQLPNVEKLTIYFTGSMFLERNVFAAIFRKISAQPYYQNIKHLSVYRCIENSMDDVKNRSFEDDWKIGCGELENSLARSIGEESATPRAEMFSGWLSTRYDKEVAVLSAKDKALLGPLIFENEMRRIVVEEICYPRNLESLDIVTGIYEDLGLSTTETKGRDSFFYYKPALGCANLKILSICVNSLNSFRCDLRSGQRLNLPNIERLKLCVIEPFERASLQRFAKNFPNVHDLEPSNPRHDRDDVALRYLGVTPALKTVRLRWPRRNREEIQRRSIENILIKPVLRGMHLKSLERFVFRGKEDQEVAEADETVVCNIRRNGGEWILDWEGDINYYCPEGHSNVLSERPINPDPPKLRSLESCDYN